MKATWLSAHRGGFCSNTMCAKILSDDVKDMNALIFSSVAKALKIKIKPKDKAKDYSHSEDKSEHFNFKNMKIGVDFDSDWENSLNMQLHKYKLCEEITMAKK